jgi:hypothetical protein
MVAAHEEDNMKKRTLLQGLLAVSIGSWLGAAEAQVVVRIAPPAPRDEPPPGARRGYVWAPGYWDWRNGRYVWVNGRWVRERRGYRWEADRWEERNGRWHRVRGNWRRGDRDGDGVRNRDDRAPNNPNRN